MSGDPKFEYLWQDGAKYKSTEESGISANKKKSKNLNNKVMTGITIEQNSRCRRPNEIKWSPMLISTRIGTRINQPA